MPCTKNRPSMLFMQTVEKRPHHVFNQNHAPGFFLNGFRQFFGGWRFLAGIVLFYRVTQSPVMPLYYRAYLFWQNVNFPVNSDCVQKIQAFVAFDEQPRSEEHTSELQS